MSPLEGRDPQGYDRPGLGSQGKETSALLGPSALLEQWGVDQKRNPAPGLLPARAPRYRGVTLILPRNKAGVRRPSRTRKGESLYGVLEMGSPPGWDISWISNTLRPIIYDLCY